MEPDPKTLAYLAKQAKKINKHVLGPYGKVKPMTLEDYVESREPPSKRHLLRRALTRYPRTYRRVVMGEGSKPSAMRSGFVKIELGANPPRGENQTLQESLELDTCPRLICDTGRPAAFISGPSVAAIEEKLKAASWLVKGLVPDSRAMKILGKVRLSDTLSR